MNKDIKEKWITALRSGDYEQGVGTLKNDRGYGATHCCLGVLCEIAVAEGVVREESIADAGVFFDGEQSLLPYAATRWAGISPKGTLFYEVEPLNFDLSLTDLTLTEMNDSEKFTFDQIADVINYFF